MEKEKSTEALTFGGVALMYLGTIMGAGFASGREAWQYFGLFDDNAYFGLCIAGFLFIAVGMMTGYLGIHLKSKDIGVIILPIRNKVLSEILGYIVALMIYTALISMSAAGGSLLNQQFGLHKAVGGLLVVFLVIITVLGDFERVSKVFRFIMPILFVIVVSLCLYVSLTWVKVPKTVEYKASPMASTWPVAAVVYVSYNIMGTIPIVSESALNAKNKTHALTGACVGGLFLAILGFVLVMALQKDVNMTNALDLPMLGFATQVSPAVNAVFAAVLFLAIYSAATSTYYGFTGKLRNDHNKKKKVIFFALLGFVLGLAGFKNIIAYIYPLEGYIGFIIIILITINFFRVLIENRGSKNNGKKGI